MATAVPRASNRRATSCLPRASDTGAHATATGSEKAAALLADWSAARSRFKVLVPPSERAAMGLEDRQAVAA